MSRGVVLAVVLSVMAFCQSSVSIVLLKLTCMSLCTGNEVCFSLETASDYVKDEKACFFGFRCTVVGYEWPSSAHLVRTFIGTLASRMFTSC